MWPCDGRQTHISRVVRLVVSVVWVVATFRTGLLLLPLLFIAIMMTW
jgi:hypothetical protein